MYELNNKLLSLVFDKLLNPVYKNYTVNIIVNIFKFFPIIQFMNKVIMIYDESEVDIDHNFFSISARASFFGFATSSGIPEGLI